MDSIPILYKNREMNFEPETLDKLRYLNHKAGKQGFNLKERFSPIINDALREYFDRVFPDLKIARYVDVEEEASKKRFEEMQEEQIREKENRRLLQLAKLRIMEREIEKIKEEEKKSGKKIELPADIGRKLGGYRI